MRWLSTDDKGETRTARYERFGLAVPDEPKVPEHCAYLLEWFWELSATRSEGMSGPNPISFVEIKEWISLTGNVVAPNEVEIIRAIDVAFLSAVNKEQREAEERSKGHE